VGVRFQFLIIYAQFNSVPTDVRPMSLTFTLFVLQLKNHYGRPIGKVCLCMT